MLGLWLQGRYIDEMGDFPESNLEKLEKLEQLRLIDAGIKFHGFEVEGNFFLSIQKNNWLCQKVLWIIFLVFIYPSI